MELGTQIRTAREKLGLSIQEMATEIGVSRHAVELWESGENVPRRAKLEALEALLGVSLSTTGSRARIVNVPRHIEDLAADIGLLDPEQIDALGVIVRSMLKTRKSSAAASGGTTAKPAKKRAA